MERKRRGEGSELGKRRQAIRRKTCEAKGRTAERWLEAKTEGSRKIKVLLLIGNRNKEGREGDKRIAGQEEGGGGRPGGGRKPDGGRREPSCDKAGRSQTWLRIIRWTSINVRRQKEGGTLTKIHFEKRKRRRIGRNYEWLFLIAELLEPG